MKIVNWLKKFLSSRFFLLLVVILLQTLLFLRGVRYLMTLPLFNLLITVINIGLTVYVVNRDVNTSYKLAWILLIDAIPVVGSVVYLLFAEKRIPKNLRVEMIQTLSETEGLLRQKEQVIETADEEVKREFSYVGNHSFYPAYNNTETYYFDDGEDYFNDLIEKIKSAKHFVFLEFFIVKEGMMMDTLVYTLRKKVSEGVQVYFMYDDGGSITTFSKNYREILSNYGIHCTAFNPVYISLTLLSKTSNRDHRKICVIDNEYGYMGGLNIGDEYINKEVRFGHWKDSAIRLHGEAVRSLTVMFIQFYNANSREDLFYEDFLIHHSFPKNDHLVLPFSDSPSDAEDVARTVHYNLITGARKYVYIATPYLILDHDMISALEIAAKCGAEVVLLVPHIPDKKTVFMVTRSNYIPLLKAGVRVYEYTPGFVHSKIVVQDDRIALVGTINMDYRSYYLHYECGTLIANDSTVKAVRDDFLKTLSVSEEITLEKAMKTNIVVRVFRSVLNVFSPLL